MSTIAVRNPQNVLEPRLSVGRRVAPRRRLAVPVSVTVLRSGVPDAMPGRSVDVCGGGVGAVLAGEVFPGELVGVEFQLPEAGTVHAKARVCYQERLRCGLQFLAIPAAQRAMLETWTIERPEPSVYSRPERIAPPPKSETRVSAAVQEQRRVQAALPKFISEMSAHKQKGAQYLRRKILMLLAASVIVAFGVGWWQWEQGWQELESRLPGHSVEAAHSTVAVAPDVMLRLLIHKVEPRGGTKVKGVAVLGAVIGRDGSVISLRPVSGPDVLTRAAMDAVQWWKFDPYRQNGQAVDVETKLAIDFR
jgi:PilZ domain/Gram-negative bacterial TonB protein C-terminal